MKAAAVRILENYTTPGRILTALSVLALSGCASLQPVTVRAPICEPPPIPASAMQPCVEPTEALKTGSLEELYVQAIRDTGPWGACIRAHDKLIEFVRYRDEICAKFKRDNVDAQPAKTGWRWPWER